MGKNDVVKCLSIPNWDKHQEKRVNPDGEVWRPPWIKVRTDTSDDYAYSLLTLRQRGLLVEMWKLAGRLNNQLPDDLTWLKRAIQTTENIQPDLEMLITRGFLVHYGRTTKLLSNNYAQEKSREEKSKYEAEIRTIYDHWIATTGRNPERTRLTNKRRTVVRARLGDFSAEDCKRALDGVKNDPWEGRSDHNDLTIVFRPENFEKFLALADSPASYEERREKHLRAIQERSAADDLSVLR